MSQRSLPAQFPFPGSFSGLDVSFLRTGSSAPKTPLPISTTPSCPNDYSILLAKCEWSAPDQARIVSVIHSDSNMLRHWFEFTDRPRLVLALP